jgi:hypothetical protein
METTAARIAKPTKTTIANAERFAAAIERHYVLASTTLVRRTRNVVEVETRDNRAVDDVLELAARGHASVTRQERSHGSYLPSTVLVFVF